MPEKKCVSEELMADLFFDELSQKEAAQVQKHFGTCSECQEAWNEFQNLMKKIEIPLAEGGNPGLDGALLFLGLSEKPAPTPFQEKSEIMTLEDVAAYLKVSDENVRNMLHLIPHFIFDNEIRVRRGSLYLFLEKLEKRATEVQSQIVAPFPLWIGKI